MSRIALRLTWPPIQRVKGVLSSGKNGRNVKLTTQLSGPDLATRARLLSFNKTQSRVVICLITGHNTLRRHISVMWLSNKLNCRKCGTEEETSVRVLCACEALASLKHSYLGSLFLDPEDIRKLNIGAIWNFAKGTGLL
jgi:hypothetical protein